MKSVLGLGNALVDVLIQMEDDSLIKNLNLPKGSMTLIEAGDTKKIEELIVNKEVPMVSGGSAANTIHGIAKLGSPAGYIGKVNNDSIGNFFKDDLHRAGIKTQLLKGNASSGRAYTFISQDSERTFATYLGAAVEMTGDELSAEAYTGYEFFHIEGYLVYNRELIEKALILAKENNMLVSIDMASYNVVEDNLEFLKKILPKYVDIVFANEEEAKAYTGKNPKEALAEFAKECDIAVVKIGKDGSLVQSNNDIYEIGIRKVVAVDTTGAGDQYAAGFIHGLNKQLSLKQCGESGALLAGKVIEKYGARISDEDWPEIIRKYKEIAG